ncbi:MAG: transglutaminase domain-containing protein [Dehalococcoidales bacterium]
MKYRSTEGVVPRERQGVVTFDINFRMPATAGELRLWLPYVMSNEYQTVEDVRIDGNFDYSGVHREDEHGNVVLYAEWNGYKEYAKLTYSFRVERREIVMKNFPGQEAPIPADIMEKYLLPTGLGPTTGDIKDFALEVARGKKTVLGKAMAIYDYIVETGRRNPDIKGCGIGNVEALLKNLDGKCVDISSVFVALSRSVGVPAREIFGTRIAKEGDITGAYHCRAEFYLPGYGWVPVDPSDTLKLMSRPGLGLDDPKAIEARDYLFGAQTETYIDFYTGRDVTLNPAQKGGQLNFLMYPYAEVDGKPLDYLAIYDEGLVVTYKEMAGSTPWPW